MNAHPTSWRLLSLTVAFFLIGMLQACTKPKPEVETPLVERQGLSLKVTEASPLRKSLQIAPIEAREISEAVVIPGQIEADPVRLVRISSPVSGRLMQVHHRLGDAVSPGMPLVTLDSADVASVYSDYSKAQAALHTAQLEYQRQRELSAAEIAARRDIENAEQALVNANNDLNFAKARLQQLGLNSTSVQTAGQKITLRSPIRGRVVEIKGAEGSYLNDPTQPILTVADLSQVWFTANIQEKDISRVRQGDTVSIVLNAYPESYIDGKVFSIGELLDPDTRTTNARIVLKNTTGRYLPAMFGRATFTDTHKNVLVVPKTALFQSGFSTRVFVETSPWVFEARVVRTGLQDDLYAEIVDGLAAGERVVVKGGVSLND